MTPMSSADVASVMVLSRNLESRFVGSLWRNSRVPSLKEKFRSFCLEIRSLLVHHVHHSAIRRSLFSCS